jgi:hypothetical protein
MRNNARSRRHTRETCAAAWKATKAKNIEDADKFAAAWLAARKAALEKAGMDVVF